MTIINLVFICWTCLTNAALNFEQKIFNQANLPLTESLNTLQIDTNSLQSISLIGGQQPQDKISFILKNSYFNNISYITKDLVLYLDNNIKFIM
jgi:hypothetical protein